MEFLLDTLLGLVLGALSGYVLLRVPESTQSVPVSPAGEPELVSALPALRSTSEVNTDYVRFVFHDGRVVVKKFRSADIEPLMVWQGRRFKPHEWTPDGHIYREVMG